VTMPEQQLICEGPCNPGLRSLDRAIDSWRERERAAMIHGTCQPLDDPDLLTILHALQHSPHRHVQGTIWACQQCQTPRKSPQPLLQRPHGPA